MITGQTTPEITGLVSTSISQEGPWGTDKSAEKSKEDGEGLATLNPIKNN